MDFDSPGPIDLEGEDVVNIILHSVSIVAGVLEATGVTTMDEFARAVKKIETDDPALRWWFDRLAYELHDPGRPKLRLIDGGETNGGTP